MEQRREADVHQMTVVKEEKQEWSFSLDQEHLQPPNINEEQKDSEPPHIKEEQEDPEHPHIKEEQEDPEHPHIKEEQEDPEPPHIKEEQQEPWPNQEAERLQGLEEADITRFIFTQVKSEDDEEEAHSSQLHWIQTEQMETEGDGENCAGPERDRNSGSDCPPEPDDTDEKTERFPEPKDSFDVEFWKETRKHQSGFTYQRNRKVSVDDGFKCSKKPFSCSDDRTDSEPTAVDDGDECDQLLSGTNPLKSEQVFVRDLGCNTDMKPSIFSECHQRSGYGLTLPTHGNPSAGEKPFGCSLCGQMIDKQESLHSHMMCHIGEKPFRCSVCNTDCGDSEALVQHMRIHTMQMRFNCTICGEEFAWRRHLTKHMEVHKIYRCSVCEQRFTWCKQLKDHRCVGRRFAKLHHAQTEESKEADPPASRSTDHIKAEADGEQCEGREPDRNSGQDSVEETGDSSEPETDDSDDWKGTKERQPGSRCSAGQKPLSCSECGKIFRKKTHLKIHLRSHTGEKPFSCSVCKKCFSQSGNLQKHMRIHTGEKLLGCSECGRRVGSQESLKKHMRIHTAERIFKCSVCCKRFSGKCNLNEHMRNHTEEKRFSCSVCCQKFTWFYQLRKHKCVGHQSSQLHQDQTENTATELPAGSSTEEMKIEGEGCGGPEPFDKTGDSSEPETDDSDDWKDTTDGFKL
ncbi:uncharacterized protein AB9W97_001172 isoform 1-T3 [Spinachia spinachia]